MKISAVKISKKVVFLTCVHYIIPMLSLKDYILFFYSINSEVIFQNHLTVLIF